MWRAHCREAASRPRRERGRFGDARELAGISGDMFRDCGRGRRGHCRRTRWIAEAHPKEKVVLALIALLEAFWKTTQFARKGREPGEGESEWRLSGAPQNSIRMQRRTTPKLGRRLDTNAAGR